MLRRKLTNLKTGDTMVEVLFAITAYSVVAMFTIFVMNFGMQQGEAALELSQARIEIAAQADAIRFIHNSFLAEREYSSSEQKYKGLWNAIIARPTSSVPSLTADNCASRYSGSGSILGKGFVINVRNINPNDTGATVVTGNSKLVQASLYPRLLYSDSYIDSSTTLNRAEGIWVLVRPSAYNTGTIDPSTNTSFTELSNKSEYYDFHIYTCWYAPGASHPTTIGTIIRLYNPVLREEL